VYSLRGSQEVRCTWGKAGCSRWRQRRSLLGHPLRCWSSRNPGRWSRSVVHL